MRIYITKLLSHNDQFVAQHACYKVKNKRQPLSLSENTKHLVPGTSQDQENKDKEGTVPALQEFTTILIPHSVFTITKLNDRTSSSLRTSGQGLEEVKIWKQEPQGWQQKVKNMLETRTHKKQTILVCSLHSTFSYLQLIPHVLSIGSGLDTNETVGKINRERLLPLFWMDSQQILFSIFQVYCSQERTEK